MALDFDMLNRLIETTERRKKLEKEVDALKEESQQMQTILIAQFEEAGIPKLTIGNKTVFIKRDLWAALSAGFEHPDGVAALKAAGFDDLVDEKFNSRTVSSFFREREKRIEKGELDEPLIPAELQGVFTTNEKFSLGIVKA